MKYKELSYNYTNKTKDEPRVREVGKYYASEVGSIMKGYLKPKDYFKPTLVKLWGVGPVLSGKAFEAEFDRMLSYNEIEFQHEPRYEVKIDDMVITVKPDFVFKDRAIETKFPVKKDTPDGYLERWKHQLELEYRATMLPVSLGVFDHPYRIDFYKYEESDELWEEIKVALINFNKELCKTKSS